MIRNFAKKSPQLRISFRAFLALASALITLAAVLLPSSIVLAASTNASFGGYSVYSNNSQNEAVSSLVANQRYTVVCTISSNEGSSLTGEIVPNSSFSGGSSASASGSGGSYTFRFNNVLWSGNNNTLQLRITASGKDPVYLNQTISEGYVDNSNIGNNDITPPNDDGSSIDTPSIVRGTPKFEMYDERSYAVSAGETTTLKLRLINRGEDNAYSLKGKLTDANKKIEIITQNAGSIEEMTVGNLFTMDYKISVPELMASGDYTLTLSLTMKDGNKKEITQELEVPLKIASSLQAKALDISDYSIDRETVKAGDTFQLTMTIHNNTGIDLENAKVELTGMDGVKFGMNSGLTSRQLNMKKDQSATVAFPLVGCDGIASIRETITAKITYQLDLYSADSAQEITLGLSIPCTPKEKEDENDKEKVFAPNIIIDSYSYGENTYVTAGQTFPLNLVLRNASANVSIQNLKVTIQGAAGSGENGVAYSPANSSNNFFFESLAAGGTTAISIDLLAKAAAIPDSYPVNVICEYEYTNGDVKAKADPVTSTLTIPLQQDDRFTLNLPDTPSECYLNQETGLSLTMVNKGKSSVYNVTVEVESNQFNKVASYYIGNVDSGKEEYYDTNLVPIEEGTLSGIIRVTYEDANNNPKELTREFTTTCMDMSGGMSGDMMGGGDMMVNGGDMIGGEMTDPTAGGVILGMPKWLFITACSAVGVLIVLIVVLVIVKKRKKKKALALALEDEGDDDETV